MIILWKIDKDFIIYVDNCKTLDKIDGNIKDVVHELFSIETVKTFKFLIRSCVI